MSGSSKKNTANDTQPKERISNRLDRKLVAESRERFIGSQKAKVTTGVLLALILASAGGYFGIRAMNNGGKGMPVATQPVTVDTLSTVTVDIDARARNGDVAGALKEYDRRIEATSDDGIKRELLAKQAVVALNNGELDTAREQLLAAEKIRGGHKVWGLLARVLEEQGSYSEAAEYYQKAADDTSTHNVSGNKFRLKAEEMRKK